MEVNKKNGFTLFLFLLPGLVVYMVLVLYPLIQALVLSTFKWPTLTTRVFVGFDNFVGVFASDIFWKSMKNSMIFIIITTALQVLLGFVLGYFVYLQLRFYRVFKGILFMPNILATVAVGFIWGYIYSPAFGLLKPFMQAIGLGQYYFPPLADPKWALVGIILAHTWQSCGVQIMLFNSGFMGMREDVLESASLDGASGWKMIRYMVIPLSWEISKTVIVLQLIGALRSFDLIYVMTGGGPNHATEVLPMHMFVQAFQNFNIGFGSVIAVIIFALAMIMTMGVRKAMYKESMQ